MPNLNRVILAGHLARDPEGKYTPNGTAVTRLDLAVNHAWKAQDGTKKEDVTFIQIAAFGSRAETILQYLKKGSPILIEGRLKQDQWEDKTTGERRYKLYVVLENFSFCGGGQRDGQARPAQNSTPTRQRFKQAEPASAPANRDPEDDNVPF